jgi:hypothetical protein
MILAWRSLLKKLITFVFVLLVLFAAVACEQHHHRKGAEITTPYAAVLLDNNQVYFGKLTNADSEFPELTDVYYIQNQVNQETKEVKNVLIRRGNEVHGPDRMFLNERHIIMVEPVGPNSKVAQLIADDKSKSAH